MGKRELIALLSLSSWCLVIVVWLFLAVSWVYLQFVIVVFPDHTHYFCAIYNIDIMRQSACLVLNLITVYSHGFLLIDRHWVTPRLSNDPDLKL